MSTSTSVNDDRPKEQNAIHRRRRGNYLALCALPLVFVLLPWGLALTLPEQVVVTSILVGTPLTLALLAAYDAATYRPNLTFCLLAAVCMWLASGLFYPDGAGWYVWAVIIIYIVSVSPWHKKFADEWGTRSEGKEKAGGEG
ncbi:hypothetical protein [Rothia nasimurium]|uniref:hypothetical protein n=1 Tax=Rothia nasimurium TaxID=85336 RepID=UPI003BA0AB0D